MKGLQGRRVVVTGGASGIGEATALRFVEEGCRVVMVDRNAAACDRVRAEQPGLAHVLVADVAKPDDAERIFADVDERLGGIDVLVNNAGISVRHRFLEITVEEWRTVLENNLSSMFYMGRLAAKRMLAAERGVIINMGSINGMVGFPCYADYNASKAGVIELTKSMALELAPHVRVLCVSPGAVLTPMQEAEYTPAMLAEVNEKIPLRRHAAPSEIAALFAFLASDEAPFFNGQSIVIDGGETAGGLASR